MNLQVSVLRNPTEPGTSTPSLRGLSQAVRAVLSPPSGDYFIMPTWRLRGLSKWAISRVISTLNGVTLIRTLLITDLLSPLGLQVDLTRVSMTGGSSPVGELLIGERSKEVGHRHAAFRGSSGKPWPVAALPRSSQAQRPDSSAWALGERFIS